MGCLSECLADCSSQMVASSCAMSVYAQGMADLSAFSLLTHFLLARYTDEGISEYQSAITIFSWRPIFENADLSTTMMWALEYDPDLCSVYEEDPDAPTEKSDGSKAKAKSTRQCGKCERENMKSGGKGAEAALPISVFLVASVLKDKSSKLLAEARGLDDVVKVFSQDKSIYEAVENAFITIYLRKNPTETAKNLLNLATDSNIGDLAALEFIVAALVSKVDISSSMLLKGLQSSVIISKMLSVPHDKS